MSQRNDGKKMPPLFFPYYVNQPRLIDVYAILNGGFIEYEEIQIGGSNEKRNGSTAKGNASAGFKLLKVDVSGERSGQVVQSSSDSTTARKVQTVTSVLWLVIQQLEEEGYIKRIPQAVAGDFVIVPLTLKINSIKALIDEAVELAELGKRMQALDSTKAARPSDMSKKLKNIANVAHELFDAEEFVSQESDYAVIGTIADCNLYQAHRQDLVGSNLMCLGQVRQVYPDGTQLMKNTVFSKLSGSKEKQELVKSIEVLSKGQDYSYNSVAITEIVGKPVYELEVVALYQEASTTRETGPH